VNDEASLAALCRSGWGTSTILITIYYPS